MKTMTKARLKSPWVLHLDCGSCNGCDIEILAALTPKFDAERFGIVNIGDPKQADVMLLTGPSNKRNQRVSKIMRVTEPGVVGSASARAEKKLSDPVSVLATIRDWKNNF